MKRKGYKAKKMTQKEVGVKMYGLAALLVILLPVSAQNTSVFQSEVTLSPTGTEDLLERATTNPQYPSVPPTTSPSTGAGEEDEWPPVEAYLYSGNAALLAQANCSRAYRLPSLQGTPAGLRPLLRPALDALTNAANFLNMIFQANDLRESSVAEDMEWYHALVRGLLEGDPLIRRALLTFDAQPASPRPQLVLRASRASTKSQDILLQDLTSAWDLLHPPPPAPDASWFTALKFPEPPQQAPTLSKRVLLNDLRTLDTPKWGRGDSYVTNRDGVRWADSPFLECEGGRFLPGWLLTLSTSFYGLKPDLSPEFRGVVRVDVSIQSFDMDQCAKGQEWFSSTHQCDRTSMQCEPISGQGFRMGQYHCRCRDGYYSPAKPTRNLSVSGGGTSGAYGPVLPVCLPCWPGCPRCEDGSPCRVQEDWHLRMGVLTIQAFFMLLVFISMLAAYQHRRSKRIRASGLLLLETILFGSLLLYFPVFILYFKPSTFRCILLRWVRLLGFAIVYGTVTLKMYRVLKVFLSRTAQRVPYMSSARLLRMLGVIVLTVSWFLSAWTAGALQNRDRNVPLLITSTTSEGQGFSLCDLDRWDYMMAVAEVLFLCWGSFLCSSVRTVPSAFHEPRYMGIAIHNELLLSPAFHLLRFAIPSLHPDWMLLLFFTHTHVTVTVTLGLLFIPKFLHVSRPLREEIAAEVYEDEVDLRRSGSCFNSSFTSAWSEHSLDPDDIRDELKKLYAQLEVHKTRRMTANNPHLQKKRISRRSLGRSIMRRITEIPESMSRQCSREDKEGSLGVGGGSQSGLSKNKVLESSSIKTKDEPLKRCVSIRKSHSSFDYARDHQSHFSDNKDPSVLDSLMKTKLAKKSSMRSDTESVDDAPLVYKSASAHNLSAENNLQSQPKMLQKSLSVMTSNKVCSILRPSKTSSFEDTSQSGRLSLWDATIRTQTKNALLSSSFDMEEVCPWELEDHLPESKSHKHVTYALSEDSDYRTSENDESPGRQQNRIWNTLQPDVSRDSSYLYGERTQSDAEGGNSDPHRVGSEGSDSDSESKPQFPVSSSAPGSPVTVQTRPKEHRVSSCHGPPRSFSLSVKGLVGSGKGSRKDNNKNGSDDREQKKEALGPKLQERGTIPPVPISTASPKLMNNNKEEGHALIRNVSAVHQRSVGNSRPWEAEGTKPCLVKQAAIRVCSSDSPERKKQGRELADGAWRPEDTNKENVYANICPWEVQQSEITYQKSAESAHMRVSADICPWEVPERSPQKTQRQLSSMADICPWDVKEGIPSTVKRETVRSASVGFKDIVSILRQRSVHANICPWEVEEPTMQDSDRTNICPWESEELEKATGRQESVYENICPWETQTLSKEKELENRQVTARTTVQLSKEVHDQSRVKVEVCPWDAPNPCQQSPQRQQSNTAAVCPWDVEDQGETKHEQGSLHAVNICPWETQDNSLSKEGQGKAEYYSQPTVTTATKKQSEEPVPPQTSVKTDVCSPEAPPLSHPTQKAQQSSAAHICPWDTEEPRGATEKNVSLQAEICPWDIQGDPPSQGSQKDLVVNPKHTIVSEPVKSSERLLPPQTSVKAEVCPWDVQESNPCQENQAQKTEQQLESGRANICPWEMEEVGESVKRQSVPISPSKAEDTLNQKSPGGDMKSKGSLDTLKKSSSTATSTGACHSLLAKESQKTADICPWESEDTKPCLVKQAAIRLPSDETDPLEPTDSAATNMQETDRLTKQGQGHSDVCPWETKSLETAKEEHRAHADICPWESLEPEKSKQTTEPEKTEKTKQKNISTDICPWESTEPEKTEQTAESEKTKQKNISTDICPWESTEPEKTEQTAESEKTKQKNVSTDVCPWESVEPEKIKQNVNTDICPWETTEPEKTKQTTEPEKTEKTIESEKTKQKNISTDICPWETAEPEKTKQNVNTDICPWETAEPEKIKQKNISTDVCPWETAEPENTKQNVNTDICPWETAEPEKTKQTTEPEKTEKTIESEKTKQKNASTDVCPWETAEPEKIKQSVNIDICPWESTEPEKTKQKNISTDICPWETAEPQKTKQNVNTDICPWETEEGESKTATTTNQSSVIQEATGETTPAVGEETDAKDPGPYKTDSNQPEEGGTGEEEGAKSNLPLARRDALCPWEMQEAQTPSLDKEDRDSSIPPWECEDVADDDAESAAEAFYFPPDL